MRLRFTAVCLALAFTTAVPVAANEYQDAIKQSATQTFNCMQKNVATLDDGISGADVIARGVAMACKEVLDRSAEIGIYGTGPHGTDLQMLEDERANIRQKMEEDTIDRATLAVLKRRATKPVSK